MFKQLLILSAMACLSLASTIPSPVVIGDYNKVENLMDVLKHNPQFIKAEQLARGEYLKKHNVTLQQLKQVYVKLMGQVSYKLIFSAPSGSDIQIIVDVAPWARTVEVVSLP